jgi:coenzyme F420-reducing hydrogenase gamma subunit
MAERKRPRLAVWKFASCDGCQLSLLDCEDELLALTDAIQIANFPEASSAIEDGPYDLSLVEGSITTAHDAERILKVRQQSKHLVTIGACATAGGIQALRNFADVNDFIAAVYASPQYIKTLATSTPISAHVAVDYELHGCPINKLQLIEVISAFLAGRKPAIAAHSVCVECKQRGTVCVMVQGTPCSGAGDACRLRGDLSLISAWLLWLLRPDGNIEHGRTGARMAKVGGCAARHPARLSHLQRGRRTVPERERCPWRLRRSGWIT